jgi:hypothetical protein
MTLYIYIYIYIYIERERERERESMFIHVFVFGFSGLMIHHKLPLLVAHVIGIRAKNHLPRIFGSIATVYLYSLFLFWVTRSL